MLDLWNGLVERVNGEPVMVLAVVQAVLALATSFGLGLSGEQVGAILAVSAAILGLIARQKVTPEEAGQKAGNPKGLEPLAPGVDRDVLVFAGYDLAAALARLIAEQEPGLAFMGRGSAFRANVAAIRNAQAS
jgi:hypothetical protein